MTTEQPTVRVGQTWADNDRRAEGRTLRVDKVRHSPRLGGLAALCTILTNRNETQAELDTPTPRDWYHPQDMRGKQTEIAVRRMRPTSTGYRLVEDVPEED